MMKNQKNEISCKDYNRKKALPWRKIATAAVCFFLVAGMAASLLFLLRQNTPDTAESREVPEKAGQPSYSEADSPEKDINIDSLSKLNYYGAKKLLSEPNATVQNDTAGEYRALAAAVENDADRPVTSSLLAGDENIYYYDIDEWGGFSISGATSFQFVLDEQNEYLVSRLGTGLIDVVITENNIDPMITFRNGDRYYSCLLNGSGLREDGSSYLQFSSHKYIEGFYIVKNFEQDNYAFEIETDGAANMQSISDGSGKIVSLFCYPFRSSTDGGSFRYETFETICYAKQMNVSYSIEELENYFNQLDN